MKKLIFILLCFVSIQLFAQVPSYVPTNGLIGYWPFSGNANDVSGNGHHGINTGGVLSADRNGIPNSSYYFFNDYMSLNSLPYSLNGTYSFAYWQKLTNINIGNVIIEMNSMQQCNYSPQVYQYNNQEVLSTCNNGNNNISMGQLDTNLLNHWVFYVWTHENGITKLYKNAVLYNTLNVNWPSSISTDITLANDNNVNHTHPSDVYLDDIGSWNRILDLDEINTLYNAQPTLVENYKQDNVLLYPTFINDNFTIIIPNELINSKIIISDILGNIIKKNNLKQTTNIINMDSYHEGVYFVKIENHETLFKIIKN